MLKIICQLHCGHYSKIHLNELLVRFFFAGLASFQYAFKMFISKVLINDGIVTIHSSGMLFGTITETKLRRLVLLFYFPQLLLS